jgi:hypothetical protein
MYQPGAYITKERFLSRFATKERFLSRFAATKSCVELKRRDEASMTSMTRRFAMSVSRARAY